MEIRGYVGRMYKLSDFGLSQLDRARHYAVSNLSRIWNTECDLAAGDVLRMTPSLLRNYLLHTLSHFTPTPPDRFDSIRRRRQQGWQGGSLFNWSRVSYAGLHPWNKLVIVILLPSGGYLGEHPSRSTVACVISNALLWKLCVRDNTKRAYSDRSERHLLSVHSSGR